MPAEYIGRVARVLISEVGARAGTTGNTMFSLQGHADDSLTAGDVLRNIGQVFMRDRVTQPDPDSAQRVEVPARHDITIVTAPQIGIKKTASTAADGSKQWTVSGSVQYPRAATEDVVITDLLPADVASPLHDGEVTVIGGNRVPVETIDDFGGTGRTLMRWTITPEMWAKDFPKSISSTFTFTLPLDAPYPGDFTNDAAIFMGPNADTDALCAIGDVREEDPLDLDGRSATQHHCAASATWNISAGPEVSSQRIQKFVKGDLDAGFADSLAVGNVSEAGGTAQYQLKWQNMDSGQRLSDPVMYDILPRVGDTVVKQSLAQEPRNSAFAVALVRVETRSPGLTVEYSRALNPCRDEVFPNSANPDCVDDWNEAVPENLAEVTAIRISSTSSYGYQEGIEAIVAVEVPVSSDRKIAWNSVAGTSVSSNSELELAAVEAPQVGVTRGGHANLMFEKTVDKSAAAPGDHLAYTITAVNTGTVPAERVSIHDKLPAGVAFVSASHDGVHRDGTVSWSLGTLAPGERKAVTLEAKIGGVDSGTEIRNSAVVEGGNVPGVPSPETVCPDDASASCAATTVRKITSIRPAPGGETSDGPWTEGKEPDSSEDTGLLPTTGGTVAIAILAIAALSISAGALLLAHRRRSAADIEQ